MARGLDARLVARILRGVGSRLPVGLSAVAARADQLSRLSAEVGPARLAVSFHVRNTDRIGRALDALVEEMQHEAQRPS